MTRKELLEMAKPILFNTDMVQAILDDIKGCTRRIVKGYILDEAKWGYTAFTPKGYISCRGMHKGEYGEMFFKLPCKKGDILYVRETWNFVNCENCMQIEECFPKAGMSGCYMYRADCDTTKIAKMLKWKPSIHMPKKAARIFLKVTDVKVERLQDMTGMDVLKEGINSYVHPKADYFDAAQQEMFSEVWNNTIDKKQMDTYGWDANPWVWVIEFEKCEKPEG